MSNGHDWCVRDFRIAGDLGKLIDDFHQPHALVFAAGFKEHVGGDIAFTRMAGHDPDDAHVQFSEGLANGFVFKERFFEHVLEGHDQGFDTLTLGGDPEECAFVIVIRNRD